MLTPRATWYRPKLRMMLSAETAAHNAESLLFHGMMSDILVRLLLQIYGPVSLSVWE